MLIGNVILQPIISDIFNLFIFLELSEYFHTHTHAHTHTHTSFTSTNVSCCSCNTLCMSVVAKLNDFSHKPFRLLSPRSTSILGTCTVQFCFFCSICYNFNVLWLHFDCQSFVFYCSCPLTPSSSVTRHLFHVPTHIIMH